MKKVVLQLFLNKYKVIQEIEVLQAKPQAGWNTDLVNAKHAEWDRIEKLIELFFESVGL